MGSTDINMSPNIAVFLLLLLSIALEVEGNDCCEEKKVGSISYTLHQPYSPSLPDQCLDNCVYPILGLSTPKYCFQQGDLLTECLSDTTTTTTTPTTTPKLYLHLLFPYRGWSARQTSLTTIPPTWEALHYRSGSGTAPVLGIYLVRPPL